ncbi:MAG: hypothetical protein NVS3B10_09580 [Polyangiales bacterium]
MRRALAVAVGLSSLALACAPSTDTHGRPDAAPPDGMVDTGPFSPDACKASLDQPASLTVGQGQTFYADVTDGQLLTWEKGPQGGHHVWIALRMIGIRQAGTITTLDLDDLDATPPVNINHSRVVYDFNRDEGGHCTLAGLRMQLDNAGGPPLASLVNHHVRVTVSLSDPDGAKATGSRTIVVDGPL